MEEKICQERLLQLAMVSTSSAKKRDAAEHTPTGADKKLLQAAGGGKLQEVKDALDEGARADAADMVRWASLVRFSAWRSCRLYT
jgi:hypothetical protein